MPTLMSFDQAMATLPSYEAPIATEQVPLAEAANRVLAAPLHARHDSPRCSIAAMDGYAVWDADTAPNQTMRVIGEARPGQSFSGRVGESEAVRIFTGAPLPEGADRCIIQEHATRVGDHVIFEPGYGPGWHVRAPARDFAAGDLLVDRGTRLTARAMVACAAADVATIMVAVRPRVAILSTGDELATPGNAAATGDTIPESVSFGVAAIVAEAGGSLTARVMGRDHLPTLQRLAGNLLECSDLVVVIGGASVGARDFARATFAAHGVELVFDKVAMKPGKPVWMGRVGLRWVLGLPGNPTAAMITASLFLRPLLAALQGERQPAGAGWCRLPLAAPLLHAGSRETFVPARWAEGGLVPLKKQDTGAQVALLHAAWLIRCSADTGVTEKGDRVDAIPF